MNARKTLVLIGAALALGLVPTLALAQTAGAAASEAPKPGEAPDPSAPKPAQPAPGQPAPVKPAPGQPAPVQPDPNKPDPSVPKPPPTDPVKPVTPGDVKLGEVNVAGVVVTGMTPAEARDKLINDLLPKLDVPITLTDGVKALVRTRHDLCAALDIDAMMAAAQKGDKWVPLQLKVDRAALEAYLKTLKTDFAFAGRNATIADDGDDVTVDPGEYKRELDASGTTAKLADAVEKDASIQKLQVALNKTPPAVPASTYAGIDGRLARFSTRFDPDQVDRTHNMKLAASTIDGVLVPAGVVFSLNEAVGERTPERGFRKAKIFEDGRITEGYGGGVSQVTGTLFNAALYAGLQIVAYRTHSRPVTYLDLGRDATVSWGNFDLKWKNNTDAPVFIRYRIEGRRVICSLYGKTTPHRTISLEVTSKRLGKTEITASLYRITTLNGKTSREKVGDSHYDWKDDNGD